LPASTKRPYVRYIEYVFIYICVCTPCNVRQCHAMSQYASIFRPLRGGSVLSIIAAGITFVRVRTRETSWSPVCRRPLVGRPEGQRHMAREDAVIESRGEVWPVEQRRRRPACPQYTTLSSPSSRGSRLLSADPLVAMGAACDTEFSMEGVRRSSPKDHLSFSTRDKILVKLDTFVFSPKYPG